MVLTRSERKRRMEHAKQAEHVCHRVKSVVEALLIGNKDVETLTKGIYDIEKIVFFESSGASSSDASRSAPPITSTPATTSQALPATTSVGPPLVPSETAPDSGPATSETAPSLAK